MASYELDELNGEKIKLEAPANPHFILLETSTGPEAWLPVDREIGVWTPTVRVSVTE